MFVSQTDDITSATFDDWRVISLAMYMALLGYSVLVGIPVISTAWVEQLDFTAVQVGRLASADLGGLTLGSVIASLLIARVNRRRLVLLGIALAVVGNTLCLFYVEYENLLLLRIIAGTGSGIYTAIAIATLGATTKPATSFNILLFAFAFTQAAELQLLPQMTMDQICMMFALLYLVSIPFLHILPSTGPATKKPLRNNTEVTGNIAIEQYRLSSTPWMILAAMFVTYICIGAYWTYIELANIEAGLARARIGQVLVWASFMSIVGCLVATVISNRFGMARPLLLALLLMAFAVSLMLGNISYAELFLSLLLFNFLWIFIDVYQMGSMSRFDLSGRFVSLMPAAQGLGQIIGPLMASMILTTKWGYEGVFTMCAGAALLALVIYAMTYASLKRHDPLLADVS